MFECSIFFFFTDPMQWSVENVHSWLSYSLTSFTSSEKRSGPSDTSFSQSASSSLWNINGQQLCSLSEEEFRQRDPLNGVKIYANLELLKMWKCNTAATSAVQPFDFGQLLNSCSPASGAASPAPSFGDEQQQHHHQSSGAGIVVKVEFDENMQTTSSAAKFSNPSSVDTSASSSASSIRNSDGEFSLTIINVVMTKILSSSSSSTKNYSQLTQLVLFIHILYCRSPSSSI